MTIDRLTRGAAVCTATWFGIGRVPIAQGTAGTLAALPVIWLIHSQLGTSALVGFASLLLGIGLWASSVYIRISGDDDPKPVVVDEVVGMAVAIAFLPIGVVEYGLAFVLFRFFDITKIWPASWVERRLSGGVAVMLDDVVAGLYAGVLSLILLRMVPL